MNEIVKNKGQELKSDFITVCLQLLPLLLNLALGIGLFLILELAFFSIYDIDTIDSKYLFIMISISLGITIGRFIFTYFLGKKSKKFYKRDYKIKHWLITGAIYLATIVGLIFIIQAIFPYLKELLLWPILSIGFIGSFDLFIVAFSILFLVLNTESLPVFDPFITAVLAILAIIIVVLPSIIIPPVLLWSGSRAGKKNDGDLIVEAKTFEAEPTK